MNYVKVPDRLTRPGFQLLLNLLFLFACGPGVSDYAQDLGGGYTFLSDSPLQKYVTRHGNFAIPNLVVDFDFDDQFIIAVRLVTRMHACRAERHLIEEGGDHYLIEEVTRILEYWIVNKRTHEVRVTRDEGRLAGLRSEAGVPEDLELDATKAPRYLEGFEAHGGSERIRNENCRVMSEGVTHC